MCELCHKSFALKSNLLQHQKKTHTDSRPFQCGVCSKRFMYALHLRRHEYAHTDQRPFPCQLCDSGYMSRRSLKNHIESKHAS